MHKEITIYGHWNDSLEALERDCVIGQWDGKSNDDHIFYWFDDTNFVHGDHGDFTVEYYVDDSGNYSRVPPECPECMCVQSNPNYKDFTNKTVHVCEQCGCEIKLIY